MGEPLRSGVIVYSKNIKMLSQFYIKMFDMTQLHETDDFISIGNLEFNMVLLFPPLDKPKKCFNRVKIFLTVESHNKAKDRVKKLGGKALEGVWSNSLFKVCNISDPEGNHIQIREFIK